MTIANKFSLLKAIDVDELTVSLVLINEYKKGRIAHYLLKYIQIDDKIGQRIKNIVNSKIIDSNTFEEYAYDCPEPEGGLVRTLDYTSTDFFKIFELLKPLNPEQDKIGNIDELLKAKAYLIVLRDVNGIKLVGYKHLPENWKLKKEKGLISFLFKNNRFEDIEESNVFSISSTIDFLYYDEELFILSKKLFEAGMNFRNGMIEKAEAFFEEPTVLNIFSNIEVLKNKTGNNIRYLKKIATIKNLSYYTNATFIEKLKSLNNEKGWQFLFDTDGKLVFTEEKTDDILTVLQNKRLHSELTEEDFDVDNVKKI